LNEPNWADVVVALSAIATPIVVGIFGFIFARRQSRSDELLKLRVEYYKLLAPSLNRLMCYITFIGTWRDESPTDIINLKRKLDSDFYSAAPIFHKSVLEAYRNLMDLSFSTFGLWGQDAKICSSAYRRRQAWKGPDPWDASWDSLFAIGDGEDLPGDSLTAYRNAYDDLLAKLVRDLTPSRSRRQFTTDRVSLNAQAPQARTVEGA
jgi:hypothetical protein